MSIESIISELASIADILESSWQILKHRAKK